MSIENNKKEQKRALHSNLQNKSMSHVQNNTNADLYSEELELKSNQRKSYLIIALVTISFLYLAYKLLFVPEKSTQDVESPLSLPELIKNKTPGTVASSEIKQFNENESSQVQADQSQDVDKIIEESEPKPLLELAPLPIEEVKKSYEIDSPTTKEESNESSTENVLDSFLGNRFSDITAKQNQELEEKERKEAKKKSTMILISGNNSNINGNVNQDNLFSNKSDLYLTIKKGKIIDVVVENAINSDYGGEIRAIVTQNIFSEWGKNILIPQGSRIFGEYNQGITDQTGRLFIKWTRIDLPTGHQISFDGDVVDNLGLKGINGKYDNKITEQLVNAFLLSAFDIGIAYGLDKIIKPVQDSTQAESARLQVQTARDALRNIESNSDSYSIKITAVCSSVLALIDMSSESYTNLSSYCNSIKTHIGTSESKSDFQSLISRFNSELDKLLIVNNQNTEETQTQEASRDAYENLTDTLRNLLFESQNWEPTVTIAQGAKVRVYVRQDYEFPQNSILKSGKVTFIK
ncbi:MAG: TrbI/VirB10 family protein [Rickettsia sp.]|nr:TrbI/VirB10 family protein [Rickettsia sp.]